jgi:glutathione S-transferase
VNRPVVVGGLTTMKLYRCKTPTDRLCACGRVARALSEAGLEYETVRVPLSAKPGSRQDVMRLTGQPKVPVVVFDDGSAMHDSARIVAHLRAGGSGPPDP